MFNARTVQLATDAPYYPAKTPARSAKNRRENAFQGAMTVQNGKAKNVNLLRTPFQPKSAQPHRLLKDVQSLTGKAPPIQLVVTHQPKPLADKTPFVNRVLDNYKTPGLLNEPLKPLKLDPTLEVPPHANPSPGSARASSTRKHARIPKPQTYHNFQTPANKGNHWEISEDDIVVPEQMEETEKKTEEEPLDFNDEIEYMAPNTLNLEYQPPFDFELPNYKLLGQDILHNFYRYPEQPAPSPPSFEFTFNDEELLKWDDLSLPSLSSSDEEGRPSAARGPHDTRRNSQQNQARRFKQPPSSAAAKKAATSNRPVSVMTLRSKTTTPASTRPNRPASSASLRPPTSSTVGATKPKTRTSATPATTITAASASSRTVRKPATTHGISTKTKPAPTTMASATTKVTTSNKRNLQSASSIPRQKSTVRPVRPASASGVGNTTTATRRATDIATIKRPNTSTSVTRPVKPESLTTTTTTTTTGTGTARRSSSTSVQSGVKLSLRKATPTTSGLRAEKKSSTMSCAASTSKTMTRTKSTSISRKTSMSDTTIKKGASITSPQVLDVDVISVECAENIPMEYKGVDAGVGESNGDSDDDDGNDDDDDETIRFVVPIKKPETQNDANNNTTPLEEPTKQPSSSITCQDDQTDFKHTEDSNLSTVEEVTEVSMSVDVIEKLEVLKLE
ncbi:hypothetical protein AGABI1DRAFT_132403 [Agaricus bisporus var. burnettii JB137-S8]|uniref:Uncharacterized protein n=1 Tax=Agaricus bisporus var. burnettii (strain JB137-S8 / ATCC MYA-4627 / FGSC 10392) TaxID=597362 RepID=K5VLJ3_AGABU|nr:uncharacterized protein AGABI1DRAFT_132403 [Agaricus bisporus var. burnettii JB137-S8]EKM75264.1 hypothetical protein AGABI1DRAFT_132403 [Agaricus bisporus var. burnettii JB137-S8]